MAVHDDFDEQAYEDDLAAQNAVEDAKYDAMFPPIEEPPDGYYDSVERDDLTEDCDTCGFVLDDCTCEPEADAAPTECVWQFMDPQRGRQGELYATEADVKAAAVGNWARYYTLEWLPDGTLRGVNKSSGFVTDLTFIWSTPVKRSVSVSPTDPAELGAWLRALPDNTILRSRNWGPCQRGIGEEHIHREPHREFPALFVYGSPCEITEGHEQLDYLAKHHAPFVVLALGDGSQDGIADA